MTREKIALFLPNRPHHVRRKVNNQRQYHHFSLGLAWIYGETRIVKRFHRRESWHIVNEALTLATRDAVADYKQRHGIAS